MTKRVFALFLATIGLGACNSAQTSQERLSAGPDAQHVGVYAYAASGDVVTLYDRDGVELGQIGVTAPSNQDRVFTLALVDGSTDVVEVARAMSDGRFLAPITPETPLTAALGDEALAPRWADFQVKFILETAPRLTSALVTQDTAYTTACSTYACQGSACTPLGCAKPANTSVGCTNPTQLPATWVDSRTRHELSNYSYTNPGACASAAPSLCQQFYGGSSKDWAFVFSGNPLSGGSTFNNYGMSDFRPVCLTGTTTNSWVASCPAQTCLTGGQYDSVPRNGSCSNPGSCTYSQGTVGCTPYH